MANRTAKEAVYIKGTNPQHLVEKIIRSRIYESRFWKEECFALSAELLVDKAMEMKYVGGVSSGNIKPSPFLCLILKMLQIQPDKDIIIEFIRNEDFKYVRFLGAFYMRLTGTSLECYKYLEPLYVDYRKMKRLNRSGKFEMVHMDELIDDLLHGERVCDIALPRIQKRHVLEELNQLEIRVSPLEQNLNDIIESSESEEEEEEEVEIVEKKEEKSIKRSTSRDRSRKHEQKKKYIDYDNPPEEKESSSRSRRRSRSRSKSRSPSKRRRSRSDERSSHSHRDHSERKHKKKHKHKKSRSRSRSVDKKSRKDRDRH